MSKQREKYEVTIVTRERDYKTETQRLSNSEHCALFQKLQEQKRSREIRDFSIIRK